MSDLLSIGASGVHAYQTALSAIAENVANASTTGYTRRQVSLDQTMTSGGALSTGVNFGGVTVAGVTRAWNDYQAAASRTAMGDAGRTDARLTWLSNGETALSDDATGVGQSATAFFTAGNALAADPGSSSNRQALLSTLDQTASSFRTTASALKTTSQGIANQAQTVVQSVNADLDSLNNVNAALRATQPNTSAQADLEDQRDRLLDNISGNIGINVTIATDGSATVKLAQGDTQLVGGTGNSVNSARLTLGVASDGRLGVQAIVNGASVAVGNAGGALGGLAESAGVVSDRRNSLDSMAADFATAVNAWQAAGTTSAGTAGQPLLAGTDATSITLATTDPTAIAAASGGSANGNLLTLTNLRGTSGVEARWSGMVTAQGQLVSSATSENTSASAQATATLSTRDQASGVDLDTEAASLLRYQQAYSGAAKVIQVAKDTLQSILDIF
jgi:flagellar hook-associated protein 1 FlgK